MFRARWQSVLLCALLLSVLPVRARAQQTSKPSSDEVISDPELADAVGSDSTAASGGGDTISDPELAGTVKAENSVQAPNGPPPEAADVRLVLHTRLARDVSKGDAREEVWQNTTVAALDATLRRSDSLHFALGVVARYRFAALAHDVPDARAGRYELDAIPTAGYVDASPGAGVHVRIGYQTLHLGRFDAFSATNVLAVNDVREGPATLAEVPEVAQLAALIDYDPSSWFSLRAIYVPFFTPNIVSVSEGDFALLRSTQAMTNQSLSNISNLLVNDNDSFRQFVAANLTRSGRERLASSGLSAFAPDATLNHGQGALRLTAHGPAGELAVTVSTALEHMPAFRVSNSALNAANTANTTTTTVTDQPTDFRPLSVEYNRFAVISMDGAIDAGPFSIGAELAYMFHRTLYSIGTVSTTDATRAATNNPLGTPVPDFTNIAQVGARIEYVQSQNWLFALEGFGSYTMSVPTDPQRGWLFVEQGHYAYAAGGLLGYTTDFRLHFEIGGAFFNGPGGILAPRISCALGDNLDAEVGGLFIVGPTPPTGYTTPNISVGGLFNNVDHVFVGLRYRP